MRVSEGHLTQQYLCDLLTEPEVTHEEIVLHNLFIHRMSVDGGFHARVITAVLGNPDDKSLLLELLAEYSDVKMDNLPDIIQWLKYEYAEAVKSADVHRITAAAALLRSNISGINISAEALASESSSLPETYWQQKTRELTVNEVRNPNLYLSAANRPEWTSLPLDDYAAYLAGAEKLAATDVFDAVLCVGGAWFSMLSREDKLLWLNMPRVNSEEWAVWTKPLLEIDSANPALSAASWLYLSGNYDAALDLYANITLAFPETSAAKTAFQMMGEILVEFGDLDYAFEAYKQAFMLNRDCSHYDTAIGLLRLCEVGEKLGEHMESYYYRISVIAEELQPVEKYRLFFDLAASYRKKHEFEYEYEYLEKLIGAEDVPEELFKTASARIAKINACLDEEGKPDVEKLSVQEDEEHAFFSIARGDASYYAFDPVCALFWYNRAKEYPVTRARKFRAAVAADMYKEAAEYADDAAMKSMLPALADEEPPYVARALNLAFAEGTDPVSIIENAYALLSPKKRLEVSAILCERSTKNDEKARMCFAIGRAYVTFGQAEDAKSVLRLGLRSNPSSELREMILSELARLDYQTGAYVAAVDEYRLALKQNERFPAAWAGLARTFVCLGKFGEALEAAEKARYYNPQSADIVNMAKALEQITLSPLNAKADRYFALGEFGYAAALYSGVESAWGAASVEDVLKFRKYGEIIRI